MVAWWLRVADPRRVGALVTLWDDPDTPAALRLEALRRLLELDPEVGRLRALEALRDPDPAWGSWAGPALGALPDATLPALDDAFAARLAGGASELDLALVDRYGIEALADLVLDQFRGDPEGWADRGFASAVRYLLRVRPAAGEELFARGYGTPVLRKRRAWTLRELGPGAAPRPSPSRSSPTPRPRVEGAAEALAAGVRPPRRRPCGHGWTASTRRGRRSPVPWR